MNLGPHNPDASGSSVYTGDELLSAIKGLFGGSPSGDGGSSGTPPSPSITSQPLAPVQEAAPALPPDLIQSLLGERDDMLSQQLNPGITPMTTASKPVPTRGMSASPRVSDVNRANANTPTAAPPRPSTTPAPVAPTPSTPAATGANPAIAPSLPSGMSKEEDDILAFLDKNPEDAQQLTNASPPSPGMEVRNRNAQLGAMGAKIFGDQGGGSMPQTPNTPPMPQEMLMNILAERTGNPVAPQTTPTNSPQQSILSAIMQLLQQNSPALSMNSPRR